METKTKQSLLSGAPVIAEKGGEFCAGLPDTQLDAEPLVSVKPKMIDLEEEFTRAHEGSLKESTQTEEFTDAQPRDDFFFTGVPDIEPAAPTTPVSRPAAPVPPNSLVSPSVPDTVAPDDSASAAPAGAGNGYWKFLSIVVYCTTYI